MRYILVAPDFWGDMTEAQSQDKLRFFPCGMCSNDQARVFHNILGQHRHIPASNLISWVPDPDAESERLKRNHHH